MSPLAFCLADLIEQHSIDAQSIEVVDDNARQPTEEFLECLYHAGILDAASWPESTTAVDSGESCAVHPMQLNDGGSDGVVDVDKDDACEASETVDEGQRHLDQDDDDEQEDVRTMMMMTMTNERGHSSLPNLCRWNSFRGSTMIDSPVVPSRKSPAHIKSKLTPTPSSRSVVSLPNPPSSAPSSSSNKYKTYFYSHRSPQSIQKQKQHNKLNSSKYFLRNDQTTSAASLLMQSSSLPFDSSSSSANNHAATKETATLDDILNETLATISNSNNANTKSILKRTPQQQERKLYCSNQFQEQCRKMKLIF